MKRSALLFFAFVTAATARPDSSLPTVSPDGSRIAFVSDRDGQTDLFVIRADGTGEIRLTDTPEKEARPDWSHDSSEIWYSVSADDQSRIYAIDRGGKTVRQIGSVPGRAVRISPSGKRVLYATGSWTEMQLVTADLDGSNAHVINDGKSIAWGPQWSPTGREIAFGTRPAGTHLDVWVMRADGSNPRQVTRTAEATGSAQMPAWSHDGHKLAVQVSNASEKSSRIWVVDPRSGKGQMIGGSAGQYRDEVPSWFPDGRRIAFQSDRSGRMEVWVMKTDGTGARQLTHADERVDLRVDTSEADAVISILTNRESADWQRLFTSEPYVRLKKREASLHRDFTDEEFQRFVLSPETTSRTETLRRTLDAWKKANLEAAAQRALRYLPEGARIRASVYPTIKPRTNSFVWETTTNPAIFLYVDPDVSPAQFENTVAHELHHIGLASLSAEYEKRIESLPPNARKAAEWMGALGEGVAMLAAAGSPDIDPVGAFSKDDQARWRQDMTGWDIRLREIDQFFADIIDGGFARPEVADHGGMTFFGYRGPWYQVGYKMAATIEKELGRSVLVATMADPRQLLARYNEAAGRINARDEQKLPLFRSEVLTACLP